MSAFKGFMAPNSIQIPYEIFDPLVDALKDGTLDEVNRASIALQQWLNTTWYYDERARRERGSDDDKEKRYQERLVIYHPNPTAFKLGQRDGWFCHYCHHSLYQPGQTIDYRDAGVRHVNVEHKQPRSRGGTDDMDNLVLACPQCNQQKLHRYTYEQFYEMTAPLRAARSESQE